MGKKEKTKEEALGKHVTSNILLLQEYQTSLKDLQEYIVKF